MDHIEGRPVNASTYTNHGCRCDGCRAASTAKMAELRARNGLTPSEIARRKANLSAATWLRLNQPDVWKVFYEREYELALESRPRLPTGDVTHFGPRSDSARAHPHAGVLDIENHSR